ncbi:hypothetical protein L1D34_15195 [Vibrio mediterranei]|uniref:hypothetical protein n=1 Tax=Vibrio mediterranei TaxID=689 RepID=UPI001EFD2B03|nr:hypothetical protein [Vibrio mediterranei]MCG9626185.1 hypothetical protein [Vibrio mediterranei]
MKLLTLATPKDTLQRHWQNPVSGLEPRLNSLGRKECQQNAVFFVMPSRTYRKWIGFSLNNPVGITVSWARQPLAGRVLVSGSSNLVQFTTFCMESLCGDGNVHPTGGCHV